MPNSSNLQKYRVKWDWRRGAKNAAQVFVMGYLFISVLLLIVAVREMGWSDTWAAIDYDVVTAPELWLLPLLAALTVGFIRSWIFPEFDVTDPEQLSTYFEAGRFKNWPRWQQVALIGFLSMMLSLPFWPDKPVSDQQMRWLESEAAELDNPLMSDLLLEIRADGIVDGSEFNRFMSKSIAIRAERFEQTADDAQIRELFEIPDQEM